VLSVNSVYIAHYSPLIERREFLKKQFSINNINSYEWFEQEPNFEELDKWCDTMGISWDRKMRMPPLSYIPRRELKASEISLAYKHIKIYEDILKNGVDVSLVLEDDVVLADDFVNKFNQMLHDTPSDWDMIFIGSGCNLSIPESEMVMGQTAYRKSHPATKCTDSYLITLSATNKIMKTIFPLTFPIDFELNYQLLMHDLRVYWWEPPLVKQGSQCGIFRSRIQ